MSYTVTVVQIDPRDHSTFESVHEIEDFKKVIEFLMLKYRLEEHFSQILIEEKL